MNTDDTSHDGTTRSETCGNDKTQNGTGPIHVWLVDDQAGLRKLIAQLLEGQSGIRCTRQFGSPNALLSTLASRQGPDVILLDVQMGEHNGIDAIPAIKSLSRSTRVLMFTTNYDLEWHRRAIDSGAAGYLLKTDPLERLTGSIRAGENVADREMMRSVPVRSNFQRNKVTHIPDSKNRRATHQEFGFVRWLMRFGRN